MFYWKTFFSRVSERRSSSQSSSLPSYSILVLNCTLYAQLISPSLLLFSFHVLKSSHPSSNAFFFSFLFLVLLVFMLFLYLELSPLLGYTISFLNFYLWHMLLSRMILLSFICTSPKTSKKSISFPHERSPICLEKRRNKNNETQKEEEMKKPKRKKKNGSFAKHF